MALQQDIVTRITNINWPIGAWIVIEIEMMSSQQGGASKLTFEARTAPGASPREFSVKDDQFAYRRSAAFGNVIVPQPGPPEVWQKDILKKATVFNYDPVILTAPIVPGAGGVDHRNLGLHYDNAFFFDVAALRKAEKLAKDASIKITFKPSMAFTANMIGGSEATPVEWVIPAYIYKWAYIDEDGVAWDTFDHIDPNYLVFETREAAIEFARDWFSAAAKDEGHPLYGWNYPGSGPFGATWSGARIANGNDYNVYSRGGPASPPQYYGDIYAMVIKIKTYKTLKEYYLEKLPMDDNGFVYDDVMTKGKLADEYEYKIAIYFDGFDNITRQLIRNRSFYSAIDMVLPNEVTVSIDKDLNITGPESPDDNPDLGGDGGGST